MDNRIHNRFGDKVLIVYMADVSQNDSILSGETKNFSKDGLCFLTRHPLEPGSDVVIVWTDPANLPKGLFSADDHFLKSPDDDSCLAFRSKVIWSVEIYNHKSYDYENGIKFLDTDTFLF